MLLVSLLPESLKERLRVRGGVVTMRSRLANLAACGFRPTKIIDGGAYEGEWTSLASAIFPAAKLLLIEAQPGCAETLKEKLAGNRRYTVEEALLSRTPGAHDFLVEKSISQIVDSSWASAEPDKVLRLHSRTLDSVAESKGFLDCDFLKLDLQGHELEVLEGAQRVVASAEVVLLEISWIPIGRPPLLVEVLLRMQEMGFRPYDIFGFNYRPLDRALWQTDVLFVKESSKLIADHRWSDQST